MLRSIIGISKHSRAFRRAMILEFQPLRSYSETQTQTTHNHNSNSNPSPQKKQTTSTFHDKLQNTKAYLKKLQTEDSVESEKMLKKIRKYGVLSVFITLFSIGIAVYDEHFGEHQDQQVKDEFPQLEHIPNLSQDIRDKQR